MQYPEGSYHPKLPLSLRFGRTTFIASANITVRRPYDIEADWILMSTCNYRCVYCFWNDEALGAKISPPARGELLASFFDRSELTWLRSYSARVNAVVVTLAGRPDVVS